MGGDALGFRADRLSPEQYTTVSRTIVEALRGVYYERVELTIPRPGKESHGDVDVLVSGYLQDFDPRDIFGAGTVVSNGGVLSFDYQGHQIDLINVNGQTFDMAEFFYSHGDLGMIMGMIMKSLGIKFGYQGLSIVLHSRQLMLSTDIASVLRFMGLDLAVWRAGFVADNEVFAFITSSRLFRHSMFRRKENKWNHGERVALEKRTMFVSFVAYVQADAEERPDAVKGKLSCEEMYKEAIAFFDKQSAVDELLEKINRAKLLKDRLNGVMIMQVTGLRGSELGAFITQCKLAMPEDTLLALTPDEVHSRVRDIWSKRTG